MMSQDQSEVLIATSPVTTTQVAGSRSWHRLAFARIIWLAFVLLTLALVAASVPEVFATLHQSCLHVPCTSTTGQLTVGDIAALHRLGLSLDAYAITRIALDLIFILMGLLVGGVLAWRRSDEGIALLVALMLVSVGASFVLSQVLVIPSIWQLPVNIWYAIHSLVVLYVLAFFPNGRLVSRWMGVIPLVYLAQLALYLVILRHLHLPGWSAYHTPINGIAWFGSEGILTLAQLYRYRRVSNQVERQQTKWVAFGFLIVLVAGIGNTILSNRLSIAQLGWPYLLLTTLLPAAFLIIPLAFGIAILRYRLWDIDLIINRTVVYGTLTGCVLALYILIVEVLGTLLSATGNLLLSLSATGLVAVLFQPLRGWLQRSVNRLMYGQRDEPYAVISRLSRQLESSLALDAVLPAIVATVAQALKLPYAAVTLKHGDDFQTAAVYGAVVASPLILPLTYQAVPIGQLVLGPRQRGEAFTPADRQLLADLGRQVGIAAHAIRLTTDLQQSREHLVTAREEERRRLRRDLHDGLGATLAALHLQAGMVRTLMRQDPDGAEAEILDLQAGIRAAVTDIRRLVYALRPPTLDEFGLVGAIHQYAAQYDAPPGATASPGEHLHVVVEAPEHLPALPAAVEVAGYRVVQEALTNVIRHAQARICQIRLSLPATGDLLIEIMDDGVGLPKAPHAGVGLLSMRERAEEVGGSCLIEPRPAPARGTTVLAHFPISKR